MKRTRDNHGAAFKAQVALVACTGDKTLAELAAHFGVHPTQITDWKRHLLERVADVFGGTTHFCTEAVQEAVTNYGAPTIFNTDQGCQFTSLECTGILKAHGIQIRMDGTDCWRDPIPPSFGPGSH